MLTSPRGDDLPDLGEALDADLLRAWPLPVDADGDKYSRGTVLVVGGSPWTPGAVVLCGLAALRMGAGRLQIATAESVAKAVAMAVVESRTFAIAAADSGALAEPPGDDLAEAIAQADSLVIGPGILADDCSTAFIERVLQHVGEQTLIVLDALAVTSFHEIDPDVRSRVGSRIVMTPNKQETAALVHGDGDGDDHAEVLRRAAETTGAVLSSFGVVQCPDGRRWSASSNPPGLGTSGSGDVLAGLVAGAASRCGDRLQAACWATFAHIEAGRRLGESVGELGYLARDLLAEIPQCLPR